MRLSQRRLSSSPSQVTHFASRCGAGDPVRNGTDAIGQVRENAQLDVPVSGSARPLCIKQE
jgi:hypothetical protein